MEKNHYLTSSIQIQSDGLILLNHSHSCPDSISKRSVLEGFHKCRAQSTSAAYTVASMTLISRDCTWGHMNKYNFDIRYIFARNCFETGLMTETEWAIYQEWSTYLLNSLGELQLDGFIYLRADPATCAGRMAKRGRPEEQGVTIDYLNQLHDKHEAWLHKREFRFVSSTFRLSLIPRIRGFAEKTNSSKYFSNENIMQDIPILEIDCNMEFHDNQEIKDKMLDQV